MRRRLERFLPIVLIAVLVQIFAPIGATWAASIAASDPLGAATICHGDAASVPNHSDPSGQPRAHDGCCSVCSVVQGGAPVDVARIAAATPTRAAIRVIWRDAIENLSGSRTGSHAQARAPPMFS
ncbi:MAG TPA: DUF2946 domain-containing protein [Bradyrhizobium sp.]|nr:DUF2946 domain-containing protein [Bradyrhizobium sp.]